MNMQLTGLVQGFPRPHFLYLGFTRELCGLWYTLDYVYKTDVVQNVHTMVLSARMAPAVLTCAEEMLHGGNGHLLRCCCIAVPSSATTLPLRDGNGVFHSTQVNHIC